MKGSIVKRGENKYSIVVDVGRDDFGKRKQRWFSGYSTKKEAERDLPRILVKLQDGELLDYNSINIEKLFHDWLKVKSKENLAATTLDGYENIVNNHIVPTIGQMKIKEIKLFNLQKYIDIKASELSAVTLANHRRVLVSGFIWAEEMELVDKNPALKLKIPKVRKEEPLALSVTEVKKLLTLVEDNRKFKLIVYLIIFLGLRRGEVLALTWDDIDLQNKTLRVTKTIVVVRTNIYIKEPKTRKSIRTIAIPDGLIPILEEHKQWQDLCKAATNNEWGCIHEGNKYNLVNCKAKDGNYFRPSGISDSFKVFIEKYNSKCINESERLPLVKLHELRHTNATLMLQLNIAPRVAAERLGHSSTAITLEVYSHVLADVNREAANKLNSLLSHK